MMNEPISSIMTAQVITVSPNDTLTKVEDILFRKGFHHIPVVSGPNKKLEGIITSFDMLKLNAQPVDYPKILVKEVMTTNVVTLEPHELIGAAAMIFMRHLFHGLPITNEHGELQGILTTHDVLKYQYDKAYPNDAFELHLRQLELMAQRNAPPHKHPAELA